MKLKTKSIVAGIALTLGCMISTSNAAVIDIEYSYDGTDMTLSSGPDLFSQTLNAGDVLNLTYTAEGAASYWDFSSVGNIFGTNLGFLSDSCGSRSSQGSYTGMLDGTSMIASSYNIASQSCVHLGPNFIDFSSVSALDSFSISYEMLSSSAPADNIGRYNGSVQRWQIWDLFETSTHDSRFVFVPDNIDVPEPSTLAVLGLGMLGLALRRKKQ